MPTSDFGALPLTRRLLSFQQTDDDFCVYTRLFPRTHQTLAHASYSMSNPWCLRERLDDPGDGHILPLPGK